MKLFRKKKKNSNKKINFEKALQTEQENIVSEEEVYLKGLAKVIDLIAPSAMGISSSHLQIGNVYCRTIFIAAYPSSLSMGWLNRVIGMDFPVDISLFIHPVNTADVLKKLRKKSTQIQSEINIEREAGTTRDPVLEMALSNVENLRDRLQEGSEKFFSFGAYFNIFGKDLEELEKNNALIESLLNSRSIYTKKAIFRAEDGFTSCIPLGVDRLLNTTPLNTSPLSTSFPFISADVTSNKGILYGINMHNNSLILFDRFSMENYNMVVFAKSGAGKSYAIKLEMLRSMMMGTDGIIIDPENEYEYLAKAVGGSFINISLTSNQHLNPFDLPSRQDGDMKTILRGNIADLLGLFKIMLGNMTEEEGAILENAIREAYAVRDINENTLVSDLDKKSYPLLDDLYEVLRSMKGAEDLTIRLEKYTKGIFSGFLNKHTNVSLDDQLVVFNIRDLEEELRPIAMYMVLHYIWNQIRKNLKKRLLIVDEAWIMMQHETASSFMASIAKRIRKYYGGLTTITQDIADFMGTTKGRVIVSNSSIQLLMKQSQSSVDAIADTFYLTDQEKYLLMKCGVGEGIFFAGMKRAAIKIEASYNEHNIITTKPADIVERNEASQKTIDNA